MTYPFQSQVNLTLAGGVAGDLAYDGPLVAFPWTLVSSPEPNIIGATAYTVVSQGVAQAGGTGPFAGVLVNPKVYALLGTSGLNQALTPSLTLPDETIGTLLTTGIPFLTLSTAANIGDWLCYNTTTGAIGSFAFNTVFTASSSTTTLTVTGTPTGFIGPGLQLPLPFVPGTEITANGTGTGGAGTYTINISQTVASQTITAGSTINPPLPPSGSAIIPTGRVILIPSVATQLAICELRY